MTRFNLIQSSTLNEMAAIFKDYTLEKVQWEHCEACRKEHGKCPSSETDTCLNKEDDVIWWLKQEV